MSELITGILCVICGGFTLLGVWLNWGCQDATK